MKLLLLLLSTNLFAMGGKKPTPQPGDEQYIVKNLTAKKQEKKEWCAASAGQMLLSKYGSAPSQCAIASKFHEQDCCNKRTFKCEGPMHVEGIARLYGKRAYVDHSPTFDEIWNLIKRGTPVSIYHHIVTHGDRDNMGGVSQHAVVAYWAYKTGGKKYIAIFDPFTGGTKIWDKSYEAKNSNLAWYRLVWMR